MRVSWQAAVVALLGTVALGFVAGLRARMPGVFPPPGEVGPGDPAVWVDRGERLEGGRVYVVRVQARIPTPTSDGRLSDVFVTIGPGWLVGVQRSAWWDPWGWGALRPGELGISRLPASLTTRPLVYAVHGPAERVQSELVRRGIVAL